MICHRIGFSPISIIGLGFRWLSSLILVPNPPARITTFINFLHSSYIIILQYFPGTLCLCRKYRITQKQDSAGHITLNAILYFKLKISKKELLILFCSPGRFFLLCFLPEFIRRRRPFLRVFHAFTAEMLRG